MGFWEDFNPLARPQGANLDAISVPNYEQNRAQLGGYLGQGGRGPYVGQNKYQGGWDSLIQQLQSAPSLAAQQYRQASQDSQAAIGGLARGSNRPGAQRAAMVQQAKVGQGMAGGSATAMMEEQASNRQQLGGALAGAGQAQWQRDQANQQAWQQMLQQQFGLDQNQFQAILQREQMRQQQSMQPSSLERGLGVASQIGQFAGTMGMGPAAGIAANVGKDMLGNRGVYGAR